VRELLDVPQATSAAVEACAALTARITHLVGGAFERVSGEEPIACQQGCSFCCHLRVMVYPYEAIALATHVGSRLAAEKAAALKASLRAAAARLEALDPSESFPAIPCPFLSDGRCSVYELRPAACAGYHSLQRGACERRFETRGGSVGIPVSRALQNAAVTVYEEAGHTVAELGFSAGRVELATAVTAVLRSPALAEEWLAGGAWPRDARGLVRSA